MNFFLHLLSSVISSSVVAALISAELAQSKERWSLRRTKIEEIYLGRGDDLRNLEILGWGFP
jgi:hypothetical protein